MCAELRVEEATHVDLFRGGYATAHAELYSRLATCTKKKIDVEKVAKAPTVEKLGSIPHTPTLEVLAAQQDLAFCFFLSVVCDYCVVPAFCLRFAFVSERSSLSGIVWADSLWNGRAGQERSGWRRRGWRRRVSGRRGASMIQGRTAARGTAARGVAWRSAAWLAGQVRLCRRAGGCGWQSRSG